MNIDDITSFLNNPMNKYIFKLAVFFVIFLVFIGRGFINNRNKVRSPKTSEPARKEDHTGQPMSNSENIGEISMRLGEDIRDVWGMGYSDNQINGVLTGKYTLDELYKMKPEGKKFN